MNARQHYRTTRPSMSGWALFLLTFIVLALLMGSAGHYLDRMDDNSHEWTEAELMLEIQRTEAQTAERMAAEQRLCNKIRGPNSEVRYTQDGDAVCTTRMGARKLVLL